MAEYSFPKSEKLKSRKVITSLFEHGNAEYHFPLKLSWLSSPDYSVSGVKAGFSVPKKKFKRAVDRNMIKRKIREAYRLNKSEFIEICKSKNISVSLFFIYTSDKIVDYQKIQEVLISQLNNISKKV